MTIDGKRNPAASGELQFDKAEIGAGAARTCGRCRRTIDGEYFVIGKSIVCPSCAQSLGGSGDGASFLRALGYGAGAALIGTLIWILLVKLFDSPYGFIAIAVGVLVGFAVRKGARGVGGARYQALAIALTYISITSSYVPIVLKAFADQGQAKVAKTGDAADPGASQTPPAANEASASEGSVVVALALVFGIALAAPFLGGASNIMGLFIIGIALYEAWKINRRIPLSGPFRVGTPGGLPAAIGPPAPPSTPPLG